MIGQLKENTLSDAQSKQLNDLLKSLNNDQKIWLGGYLTGIHESTRVLLETFYKTENFSAQTMQADNSSGTIKILYGTRSGNSLKVSKKVFESLQLSGVTAQIVNLNEYEAKNLKKENNVLIVISTDGEGEPPVAAEEFYNFIMGRKAPGLENLKYSVLALGDSSYKHFCKIGKDIDSRLAELGAQRISERIDCDVDFEPSADIWTDNCLSKLLKKDNSIKINSINQQNTESVSGSTYTKSNLYPAKIIDKIQLNGKGSSKRTFHFEFSLEGSGLSYHPGDALGVKCRNEHELVDAIIKQAKLNPLSLVEVDKNEKTLRQALTNDFEISTLTGQVIENYAKLLNNKELNSLIKDKDKVFAFTQERDILDLITEFPAEFDSNQFIAVLRKLQPRLYSIASSQTAYSDEVHLTVGEVAYNYNNRLHKGACSNFLSAASDEQPVYVYIDENISFRLPYDNNIPVIMIGAGTGIAPYRAFMQERAETGAGGKSWLFFGERNFTTDFLYQVEWQKYLKNKTLDRLDVAFSRDQAKKIYVQHKLIEHKKELFRWIEDGAHIYLCGDKNSMASDVKNTLTSIIQTEGGLSLEKATEYFKQMRRELRFHEDVY